MPPQHVASESVGCVGSRWATIDVALAEADDGAVLTVCEGEYEARLRLEGRALALVADGEVTVRPLAPERPIAHVSAGGSLELTGVRLADALAGAVVVEDGAFTCTDCELVGNGTTSSDGGAIRATAAEVHLERSALRGNLAARGAAVFADQGASVTLSGCEIVDNEAVEGAALYLLGADAVVEGDPADPLHRGRLVRNVATGDLHGAVELYPSEDGLPSTLAVDHVFWSEGEPAWAPVDANLVWDVFFGFDEGAPWGYRFGATRNDEAFSCSTEVEVDRPGLCDL